MATTGSRPGPGRVRGERAPRGGRLRRQGCGRLRRAARRGGAARRTGAGGGGRARPAAALRAAGAAGGRRRRPRLPVAGDAAAGQASRRSGAGGRGGARRRHGAGQHRLGGLRRRGRPRADGRGRRLAAGPRRGGAALLPGAALACRPGPGLDVSVPEYEMEVAGADGLRHARCSCLGGGGGGRQAAARRAHPRRRGALPRPRRHAVTNRRQFGRPLAAFQAMRHLLARQKLALEGIRGALTRAAAADAAPIARQAAFLAAAALGPQIAEAAIQAHGGMGFTWDIPLHRYLRRIRSLEAQGEARAAARGGGGGTDRGELTDGRHGKPAAARPAGGARGAGDGRGQRHRSRDGAAPGRHGGDGRGERPQARVRREGRRGDHRGRRPGGRRGAEHRRRATACARRSRASRSAAAASTCW